MPSINVIAPINPITGYHKVISGLCNALHKRGWQIRLSPRGVELEYGATCIPDVQKFIVHDRSTWKHALNIDSFLDNTNPVNKCGRFTMWESTDCTDELKKVHKENRVTIFPCKWNAKHLRFSKNIEVVPLGVDPKKFFWHPQHFNNKFVFGVAGRMKGFSQRKRLFEAAEWFTRAFPRETDVELQIKGFPDDQDLPAFHPFDRRIRIIKQVMSEEEYIRWMAGINVLISTSTGEGWGLCQNEALAMGRPVIMPNYGGLAEFFTPLGCYGVDYKEIPVNVHHYRGMICRQSVEDTVAAMQYAYTNPNDVVRRGLAAADFAAQFTWERSAIKLEKVLRKYELTND